MMALTYSQLTEIGSRDNNEDACLCLAETAAGESCFIVADGLGGHGGGEIASRLAVEAFRDEFACPSPAPDFLPRAFAEAQRRLESAQSAMAGGRDMLKTTAVALWLRADCWRWGHVGDSRLYFFEKNKLKTRTLDHSVPQMLALAGDIRESQIRRHPDRNRLLRVLGTPWENPPYALGEAPRLPGQAFLLASDGFWEYIEEKIMVNLLKKSRDAEEWLGLMRREAEKNGAGADMDNYTAITVRAS